MKTKLSEKIKEYRKNIDALDASLIRLVAKRTLVCRKIQLLKKISGIPLVDYRREREIIKRVSRLARKHHLKEDMVRNLLKILLRNNIAERK